MSDLISRSKLLENMKQQKFWNVEDKQIYLKCVEDAPAEEAEPAKRAYWFGDDAIAICSECESCYDPGDGTLEEFRKYYHYCPNCGALMDENEHIPDETK